MADTSDYIRGGAFVLLFLLTGLRDLNTWLVADLVFTGFTGFLLYLNPAWTITLQTKDLKVDVIHGQLNRLFASFLLGPLLLWLLRRKTEDSSIKTTMLVSRAMGIMVLLVVMGIGQLSYGEIFTDKHFWFGFLGNILWCVANIFQLVKNRPELHGVRQSRGITLLSHINSWILLLLSLSHLAFPNAMCKVQGRRVDKYHIHTTRSAGALMMGWCILTWLSPRFQKKEDVRIVYLAQLLIWGLSEGTYLILHFQSGLTTNQELAVRLTTFLPLFLLAVVGVYLCSKTTSSNTEEKKDQ
ncbi:uncharacterized protein LOC125659027 [Ostrea edulis]|uniref:uncharacterized protein LOC125659027 n=1 Tax=Ostrea edulis TaxID=37623 RepID=UPI0020940D5E|nr:uncharacterized protein LOC125659027 [Ostrea edulis]XP_048746510.1 uncharacterized protein LOC125659027 [Ostrea edulis]